MESNEIAMNFEQMQNYNGKCTSIQCALVRLSVRHANISFYYCRQWPMMNGFCLGEKLLFWTAHVNVVRQHTNE